MLGLLNNLKHLAIQNKCARYLSILTLQKGFKEYLKLYLQYTCLIIYRVVFGFTLQSSLTLTLRLGLQEQVLLIQMYHCSMLNHSIGHSKLYQQLALVILTLLLNQSEFIV